MKRFFAGMVFALATLLSVPVALGVVELPRPAPFIASPHIGPATPPASVIAVAVLSAQVADLQELVTGQPPVDTRLACAAQMTNDLIGRARTILANDPDLAVHVDAWWGHYIAALDYCAKLDWPRASDELIQADNTLHYIVDLAQR